MWISDSGNGELIYPPEGATRAQRLQVAIDVLRQGKMLFICADTPRKPSDGVPVTIFGRTTYFPTGVYIMSLRTGAPVVPATWHWEAGQYHIHYDEPIELTRGGDLKRKAIAATQKWAESVDSHLHKYPEMWWNWLDKRWTRIIRNTHPDGPNS
ncbi:MAG: LpxL/LpxP family acyltransferase [Planctomycetota bacterium]|jgi:lauroyl/myristoyl acyltransferase